MPRDQICPKRPRLRRDPCTIRAPMVMNGNAIVESGARKLRLALSIQIDLKVFADNLLLIRFGWQQSPWWYSDAKRVNIVWQLTQALSATYLANPLIKGRRIPHCCSMFAARSVCGDGWFNRCTLITHPAPEANHTLRCSNQLSTNTPAVLSCHCLQMFFGRINTRK